MAKFKLQALPFLGGYSHDFGDVKVSEIDDVALVSLALAHGASGTEILQCLQAEKMPDVGHSIDCLNGCGRLMRMGLEQFMLYVDGETDTQKFTKSLDNKLSGSAYVTDQSHVWVCVDISGPMTHPALERICPLNISLLE